MRVVNKSKIFVAVGLFGVVLTASVFFINRRETRPHYAGEPASWASAATEQNQFPVEKVMRRRLARLWTALGQTIQNFCSVGRANPR